MKRTTRTPSWPAIGPHLIEVFQELPPVRPLNDVTVYDATILGDQQPLHPGSATVPLFRRARKRPVLLMSPAVFAYMVFVQPPGGIVGFFTGINGR